MREHGTEAVNMLFTEFNMEDALAVRYEEGKEEGKAEGEAAGKRYGMELAKQILDLLRQDLSVEETAARLGVSEEDVRHMAD